MDTSSLEDLWGSLHSGVSRRAVEAGRLFAVMWPIWLYSNVVVFKGRMALMDGIVHDMECLVSCWFGEGGKWLGWGESGCSLPYKRNHT